MKRALIPLTCALMAACSDTTPPKQSTSGQGPSQSTSNKVQLEPSDKAPVAQQKIPSVKTGQITGVDIGQLFTLQQSGKVHLIDVRPPLYYHIGHIDEAVNFPLIKYDARLAEQLPQIKQAIATGKTVVLYCQNLNCPDAYKTAQKIVKLGHSVSVYKGGWEEWKKSGL